MTGKELADKLVKIAKEYKTLYVYGCFGAPLTAANKERYQREQAYNRSTTRKAKINAASAETFGFDCVNLIKGVLWGWNGDKTKSYGGAAYKANSVPDVSADGMFALCSDQSSCFDGLLIGEAVWMKGHIGIYIGDGLAVECTPSWTDGVQITACNRTINRYRRRNWTKHGRLPWITYPVELPQLTGKGYLVKGDCGEAVAVLQNWLRGKIAPKLAVDGSFGPATETAVKQLQKKLGLTVDGSFGPKTLEAARKMK